ncbi:hypothetical protein C8R45DRAFT_1164648 [Mycena sanguinolenta]|nr:hypothetical protein C8R45DRAFT_1164648 [Mycena sanguinolenta]
MSTSYAGASRHSQPQVVHNYYTSIYGGQGGVGGQGVQGGGGGTGEGPTVHQNFPSSTVAQASQLLNHCPPPSRIFHGRRTILDTMHRFFAQDTGKQRIYVLYGLGGAQIALKFIEEWSCFTDRLLVDASTTETIETGLENIASIKKNGNSMEDGLSWLRGNQEKWLLFFDNADDPEINLNQFFPKCNHGNIIITSRNPNLRVYGAHSHVSDMDELDAVALLLKSAQQKASETNKVFALDIVKALWFLPLAIVQAGAFIFESGTLDTYLNLFIKNQTELLKKKPTQNQDDYAWAVYTTWEMSFNKLSQPAAMLLQLCSLLHRDDIFQEIFSRAANRLCKPSNQSKHKVRRLQRLKTSVKRIISLGNSQSENSLKPEVTRAREFLSYFVGTAGKWDSLRFLEIISEIKGYSLINFDAERKSFSIHPLVHSWSRTTLNDPERYHLCIDEILGTSICKIPGQDRQSKSLRLVSHVDSVMQVISKNTHFQQQYASIYYSVSRHAEPEDLEITKVENILGNNQPDTVTIPALTHNTFHRFEQAEKLQLVVLETQRKLHGDDHVDTLGAMQFLANIYYRLGRFKEAEKLKVDVLQKRKKLLGDDHLDTLSATHNLANTYHRVGRFKEAEKLQVIVLEKRKKLLGDDHLNTLTIMKNLANTYYHLHRFEEAEQLQTVVLEKRRKLLGDDHLHTLEIMSILGYTYFHADRFEEAEKLLAVVLEKRQKILGDDHPHTLTAMKNLGNTYYHLHWFARAEKLQVVVLDKLKKSLGEDHLDTLTAINNLGLTYYGQSHFVKAEDLQVIVLERRRRQLSSDCLETQQAMQNLANTYHSLGKDTEAAEIRRLLEKQ